MSSIQTISILGATGSIGESTLDVIRRNRERFEVFALSAHRRVEKLFELCREFDPQYAVLATPDEVAGLQQRLNDAGIRTEVLGGDQALIGVASASEVDTLVAAIVGAAGLPSTYAAVCKGKRVLLANKEALVMSGKLMTQAVKRHNAELLPIDSEHNAIFQCLPSGKNRSFQELGIRKVMLTGSGGPFRDLPLHQLDGVTPEQACDHPNWSMGKKISVDSATMMNKGLEFIEACWLFDLSPQNIDIVVHPQSIIHSMVEYVDGSVLAQLGNPDMRTPIAHCLGWPDRIESGVASLDFYTMADLKFEAPDFERFPCLKYAIQAIETKGEAPVALNAANEIAVESFLAGRIRFTDIAKINAYVMSQASNREPVSLDEVLDADSRARALAVNYLAQLS
ncbi:1-deoxy-D-xylulose-5-phosphate reductoisomerase [Teredinibacter sp. KSP-S5-2]|nr:1-deoxy-D-xylulose-5-phosphate reductoisomerase [Teredinibacter sp. KSP-S5-2]WNO09829.1 1-deoxy-D-xylulose-5-phosphate reductoisomerase [Teredinibacter sp. KSP-S5-2]